MLRLISDLDNFLYPGSTYFDKKMYEAAADTVIIDFGIAVGKYHVFDMINRGMADHNEWMRYLVEAGVEPDRFHDLYHKRLDHRTLQRYPALADTFQTLGSHASHVLLTHGSVDWALRTLDHLGLRQWYPDERILGWEKYKAHKHSSRKGFEMALALLEVEPPEAHFGDDNIGNLVTAKTWAWKPFGCRMVSRCQRGWGDILIIWPIVSIFSCSNISRGCLDLGPLWQSLRPSYI